MAAADLPPDLASRPFSVREARRSGLSRSRLRARDLERSFSGVRTRVRAGTVPGLAREYLAKLSVGEFFSHATSALLLVMWLPLHVEHDLVVHVSVRKPQRVPRDRAVRGHHLIDRPGLVWRVDGMPVANPWETWAQLAWLLTEDELVVAAEALLAKKRPRVPQMHERLASVASDPDRHFHAKLARAAARMRIGSRSAAETRFRLFLVRNGLPEPEINVRLLDRFGRFLAEGDLVYRRERVLIEYEGDHHRERTQFRKDITRIERIQDDDWHVIRVTEDDVKDYPKGTIDRIGRALLRRRPAR